METEKTGTPAAGGRVERALGYVSNRINTAGSFLSGLFILVMGIIISYDVAMRYLFHAPTTWVLEISIILCLGSVFLAGGYALKEKNHIQVDALTRRCSKRNQVLLELISLVLTLVYCVVLTWKGAETALYSLRMGEVSPTVLNIPVVIPRVLLPIGGLLLILELVRQTIASVRTFRGVLRDGGGGGKGVLGYLPPLVLLALLIGCGAFFLYKDLAPLGLILLVFVLIFAGMPIAFALGLLGLMGFAFTFGGGGMLGQIPLVTYKILDDFIIVSVPLFLMLAAVLSVGKVGYNLFEFASSWVRHLPGGLGVATVFACAIFAAMCGSAVATVATIGLIAIPEMLSRGYRRELVFGTVAIGGVLGPLIPPSIYMILIGAITGDSVGKLFMAGMLPGILLAALFSLYIIVMSVRDKNIPKFAPATWAERWAAVKKAFFGLMAPIIVLGGIYTGIFTPTEAAGVGLVYSLLVCFLISRSISLKKFYTLILDAGKLTATILFIVAGAVVFGQLVSMLQIPDKTCTYLASLPLSPMVILFIALILILVLGALMDEASILLITYPTLYYIFVKTFGFDPIWFALVFVFTLEVGLVAPPVGINVFVVQSIWKDAKFEEIVKGVLPFALLMVVAILLVIYVKPLSLWLPNLVG